MECFPASREESFKFQTLLLWTINDFLAYGNFSGYSVKGYHACPICGENTCSKRLEHGKKNFVTWAIDDFYHKPTIFLSKRRLSTKKRSMLELPNHCQGQRF